MPPHSGCGTADVNLVIGQLARRLGVPLRCGGSLTASKVADAQAAAESADSMLSTALGGANAPYGGRLAEGGLCTGYEAGHRRDASRAIKSCCVGYPRMTRVGLSLR